MCDILQIYTCKVAQSEDYHYLSLSEDSHMRFVALRSHDHLLNLIFLQGMQHIWLGSGILVFMNGLTPQRIVALIPFMAFTLELKITLIIKGMTFLICMITKSQSKIKEEFIQPGFTLRLTISKLVHQIIKLSSKQAEH